MSLNLGKKPKMVELLVRIWQHCAKLLTRCKLRNRQRFFVIIIVVVVVRFETALAGFLFLIASFPGLNHHYHNTPFIPFSSHLVWFFFFFIDFDAFDCKSMPSFNRLLPANQFDTPWILKPAQKLPCDLFYGSPMRSMR